MMKTSLAKPSKLNLIDKANLQLFEATDGLSALKLIQKELPSIIFLDLQMPLLTGFEVTEGAPSILLPLDHNCNSA